MEAQKIINLLEEPDDKVLKFATRKWYVINDRNNGQYGLGDENDSTIKFDTEVIKPNLCDFSDAYILVIGDIAVVGGVQNTDIAFKNCSPFTRCITHLNDEHVETDENLDIIMNMYNIIGYSDNYSESSGSLWQYKRDEQNMTDAGNPDNVITADPSSFKYKSSLLSGLQPRNVGANVNPNIAQAHRLFTNAKIAVPLKYISNFFRLLERPLINCKIHFEISWTKNSVMSSVVGATTFQITSTKFYVAIVTLPTKENLKLTKQLNDGFKRSVYWNEHISKLEIQEADAKNLKRFPLDASQNFLFFVIITQMVMPIELKEIVIENASFQE